MAKSFFKIVSIRSPVPLSGNYQTNRICACHWSKYQERNFALEATTKEVDDLQDDGPASSQSWYSTVPGRLYRTHLPSTLLQKTILAVGSAGMSLFDPYRHDMIATLGETTGYIALQRLQSQMMNSEEGREILRDKPRINTRTVDMDALENLPNGSFGKEYHRFMAKNKITSDSRDPVHFVDDPELAYVMQRYREVHDFNHLLLGMPTNMLGEVVVKWFEMINTGLPMCTLGALFGPLRLNSKRMRKLVRVYLPEIIPMAMKGKPIINMYYEKRWEQPISDLREELGLHVIKGKVK